MRYTWVDEFDPISVASFTIKRAIDAFEALEKDIPHLTWAQYHVRLRDCLDLYSEAVELYEEVINE